MSPLTRTLLLLLVFTPSLGADCEPDEEPGQISIYPTTPVPPGRSVSIDSPPDDEADIRISVGLVTGFRCWDSCDYTCEEPELIVADDSIAHVLNVYRQSGYGRDYVLIASGVGSTQLTVRSACAELVYPVTVTPE